MNKGNTVLTTRRDIAKKVEANNKVIAVYQEKIDLYSKQTEDYVRAAAYNYMRQQDLSWINISYIDKDDGCEMIRRRILKKDEKILLDKSLEFIGSAYEQFGVIPLIQSLAAELAHTMKFAITKTGYTSIEDKILLYEISKKFIEKDADTTKCYYNLDF